MPLLKQLRNDYSYLAYGLGIRSRIPLPELSSSDVKCDVYITIEDDFHIPQCARGKHSYHKLTPDEAILFDRDIGLFLIRKGRQVVINPTPAANMRTIQLYVVGVVMTFLLHQRGHLVLHANSVRVGCNGILFLGPRGCGKSSTAAALYSNGNGIIADDVTAIEFDEDLVKVPTGYPQLKISRETASLLGYNPEKLIPLPPAIPKLGFRTNNRFSNVYTPLKHVYLLKNGPSFEISPVRAKDAFLELIQNSIFAGGRSHFVHCANLIKNVPFFYIRHPFHLSKLPQLAKDVEEHFIRKSGDNPQKIK